MRTYNLMMEILAPFAWFYHIGLRMRHYMYDCSIFKKKYAEIPVVSIGNLIAGGAGKTQAALLLAEELVKHLPVAILSRGYLSRAEQAKAPVLVLSDRHTADACGDEPLLLALRLQSVPVYANRSRFKSALAAKKQGARILILDDGMQHRKLHRDFELVVIDGNSEFGPFLPQGNLREDPIRLKYADLILFIGEPLTGLQNKVSSLTTAPQVVAKIGIEGAFLLDGTKIENLKGEKVAIFCGIGNPIRFVNTVKEMGVSIVATHFLKDHRSMSPKELQTFAAFCQKKGAVILLCTEKDKVKIRACDVPLPIGWIKARLEILSNRIAWEKSIDHMKLLARKEQ
jgi:tetraacyldisaccharide 4'-kinase